MLAGWEEDGYNGATKHSFLSTFEKYSTFFMKELKTLVVKESFQQGIKIKSCHVKGIVKTCWKTPASRPDPPHTSCWLM